MSDKDKIHVLSRAVIIDQSKILLCKTTDLENNFYFLPGGHIEHGESARNSLVREWKEETGFDCEIKRFLGCIEYSFEPGKNSICHNHEYNFIFEAKSDNLKSNKKILSPENHIELIWVLVSNLNEIDFRPDPLRKSMLQLLESKNNLLISEMK